ncbi:MAG: ABC transporter permease [Peptococcaceae bacterium]|jgi:NitT/TauT family transport system permease protein|nr:ABC transporter permease [Peptococcaceae bacterium]
MFKKLALRSGRAVYKIAAIILFLVLWEIAARFHLLVSATFLPPFSKVITVLYHMALSGELWRHASISLQRSLIGFTCGMLFAVPLGLAIGWFQKLGNFLSPLLQVFRNMPTLALLPVFVMFFGIGELSKVMVIFWGVLWAVLLNTIAGVQDVDPQLIKAARSMGTSSLRLFATVVLPASLPFIFTGMRISATTSILILIAAEMVGASRGLGYALYFYQGNMKIPEMYGYIIVMAILGVVLNYVLEALERRNFRWRDAGGIASE